MKGIKWAGLTSAALGEGVAIVTQLAAAAVLALRVVQALEAGPSASVARARVHHVDVAVALARDALAAGLVRVAIVTRRALIAPGT